VTDEELRRELALLKELGYTHLDVQGAPAARASAAPEPPPPPAPEPPARPSAPALFDSAPPPPPRPSGPVPRDVPVGPEGAPDTRTIIDCDNLADLAVIAAPCTRCRLARTRTQVVFGTGNPNADLMFVGEAPGRDEDQQGKPFVGRAGQLLTDIIKAMRMTRDDVFIANVIKCRPPENRNPEPDELDACRPYIRRQIEMIRPKVIVVLGRFALQSLTEKAYSISSVRGQWLQHEGVKIMPTYHPAYLLRNPAAKKDVWQDMKKVMTELGITP